MWAALIPEGPLHPEDAVAAVVVGLLVALALGRRSWAVSAVVVSVGVVFEWRHPTVLLDSLVDRPSPAAAVLAAGAAAVSIGLLTTGRLAVGVRATLLLASVACAAVWATAPDTEAALIGGVMLVVAVVRVGSTAVPGAWLVFVVPAVAALVGTVGRPGRLGLVLAVMITAAVAGRVLLAVGGWLVRRQRAGTPVTVAPGATSAVTTAPAPTTAP